MTLLDYMNFISTDSDNSYSIYFPKQRFLDYCRTHDTGGKFEEVLSGENRYDEYLAILKARRGDDYGVVFPMGYMFNLKSVVDLSDIEVACQVASNAGKIMVHTNLSAD